MYKDASKLKLRVLTNSGNLSVEQLWDLPVTELDKLAVHLEEQYKNSAPKSFLTRKTSKNKLIKLQFDIVLDIMNTKMEEADKASAAEENRAYNKEIDETIMELKKQELKGKSIKELEKMRR